MVITLSGQNDFGRQTELNRLVSDFISEHGDLALERLDGEEADYSRIVEALNGLPFLAVKKMVVLRMPSKNKKFVDNIEQVLDNLPETTEVILVEPKLDKRLVYYKLLKKRTDLRDYSELDAAGLRHWLVGEAKRQKANLSPSDARYLVDRIGTNQQILDNELYKLITFDPKITRQNIDQLTEPTPQSTVFELLEAAFAGNAKRTLELYAEQRALKVEPPQIVAMLAWQLHILAVIKTAGERSSDHIAKEAKLSPFVVRKSQSIARNLQLSNLKQLIADLLEIDIRSKTSNLNVDEALQTYLVKLAS